MPTNLHAIRQGLTEIGSGLQSMSEGVQRIISALPFEVDAVTMGSTDWISGNQTITDGPEGSLVMWVKVDLPAAAAIGLFSNADSYVGAGLTDTGLSGSTYFYSSDGVTFVEATANSSAIDDNVWGPVFVSWKTDFSAGNRLVKFLFGDVSLSDSIIDAGASFSVFYNSQPFYIGRQVFESQVFVGDMAEVWFDDSYIDFSTEANRRKFATAGGKPVDVGTDGSTPTGGQPIIYLSVRPGDAAADFVTNRGTGGNFTQNGTLSLAGTSPSD